MHHNSFNIYEIFLLIFRSFGLGKDPKIFLRSEFPNQTNVMNSNYLHISFPKCTYSKGNMVIICGKLLGFHRTLKKPIKYIQHKQTLNFNISNIL